MMKLVRSGFLIWRPIDNRVLRGSLSTDTFSAQRARTPHRNMPSTPFDSCDVKVVDRRTRMLPNRCNLQAITRISPARPVARHVRPLSRARISLQHGIRGAETMARPIVLCSEPGRTRFGELSCPRLRLYKEPEGWTASGPSSQCGGRHHVCLMSPPSVRRSVCTCGIPTECR